MAYRPPAPRPTPKPYTPPVMKERPPAQVVAEVGDDFTSLASKLGVDAGDLANANKDTNNVSAGAAYNVPNVPSYKNASPTYNAGGFQDPRDRPPGTITQPRDTSPYSGYNPPIVDPRSLTVEEGVYGNGQTPSQPKANMWDGHDYWTGHVDPYRLALNLAKEQGINLPPHPSENINDYMWSGDFASNYLRDIRDWEDNVYGGTRTSMVDIIMNDDVLYGKLMSDQLTTGDLLEVHRELPAYADQFYGGMDNYPIEDQATYDILGKLGYIPNYGGGYGGYSTPSYSYGTPSYGGGYRQSAPRQNNYPAQLSLTSWSI